MYNLRKEDWRFRKEKEEEKWIYLFFVGLISIINENYCFVVVSKDISFWVNLSDHILDNRFDCDHDEVYAAMIGFNGVRDYCRHEW